MDNKMENRVNLFTDNAQVMKKEFTWQNDLAKRLAALLYAQENKPIKTGSIQQCHALIKQNTGVFSTFRGDIALCVAALLSLSPNPQFLLDETLKVYDLLKAIKFHSSDYLAIAACQIAAQTGPANYTNTVKRTRVFYDGMKARHFLRTGQDDYIFAAMLGLSDLDVTEGTDRIEQFYNRLKDVFWDKNSVQALSQVLVLAVSDDTAIGRVIALRDALRARNIKMDKSYTLPALGILALLPVEIGIIVRDIDDTQQTLRAQKGFGSLSVAKEELLIYAAGIVAGVYADTAKTGIVNAALSTSITNIIIAQQAAMIAAVSASTAAAASSSS